MSTGQLDWRQQKRECSVVPAPGGLLSLRPPALSGEGSHRRSGSYLHFSCFLKHTHLLSSLWFAQPRNFTSQGMELVRERDSNAFS